MENVKSNDDAFFNEVLLHSLVVALGDKQAIFRNHYHFHTKNFISDTVCFFYLQGLIANWMEFNLRFGLACKLSVASWRVLLLLEFLLFWLSSGGPFSAQDDESPSSGNSSTLCCLLSPIRVLLCWVVWWLSFRAFGLLTAPSVTPLGEHCWPWPLRCEPFDLGIFGVSRSSSLLKSSPASWVKAFVIVIFRNFQYSLVSFQRGTETKRAFLQYVHFEH